MEFSEKLRELSHSCQDFRPIKTYHEQSRSSMVLITDLVSGIDDNSAYDNLLPKEKSVASRTFFYVCPNPRLWCILTILGVLCTVYAILIDFICLCLTEAQLKFIEGQPDLNQLLIWLIYGVFFAAIAASCGKYISKDAEGSGIPEMKTIIGGAKIKEYLSYHTLSSKTVGIIAATASGLSVGKEGPFVHISCIVADKLTNIPFFNIQRDSVLHKQILAAAVAVGVGITFGSPMGGVLFSIEIASTYYNVSNLWKSLYGSTICCLLFKLIEIDELTNLITSRHYADAGINSHIFTFIPLGIFAGLLGALFVYALGKIVYLKKNYPDYWFYNRYLYTISACVVCSLLAFFFDILKNGDRLMIQYMFKPDTLKQSLGENALYNIGLYSIVKFATILLSISCPIPCGVFTPIFALGAVLGRIYGEVFYEWNQVHPGVYALVGAAALTSSVTQTISVIVIVFELSGQISYLPFMLVGVLTSYAVSSIISSSIYDLIITLKKIPFIASIRNPQIYSMKARDIMAPVSTIPSVISMRHLWKIIIKNCKVLDAVPVVDDFGFLIGEVKMKNIIEFVRKEYLVARNELVNPHNYDRYFEILEVIGSENSWNLDNEKLSGIMLQFIERGNLCEGRLKEFWKTKVLLMISMQFDRSPFTENEDTQVSKVHYLFVILGILQIYITQKGQITGVITRKSFLEIN